MEKKSRLAELKDDISLLKKGVKYVWDNRKTYIIYAVIGCILSLVISFSIPKNYVTSAMLAPEMNNGGASAGMAQLASVVGINMQDMSGDAYTVDLYPTIVSSTDFLMKLSKTPVKSSALGIETTYGEYLVKHQKYAWWSYPVRWTKSKIGKLTSSEQKNGAGAKDDYPLSLSKKENAMCEKIKGNVRCAVDDISGVIMVSVSDQDPEISAIMTNEVAERLNQFIQDYRTQKARADYAYVAQLCDSAKVEYLAAQKKYADFVRTHTNVYSPEHKLEMEFLENEVSMAYNAYNQMTAQRQLAQTRIGENTPVFTVIEPAYVPLHAASPKKMLIMILFVFLSFIVATVKLRLRKAKE